MTAATITDLSQTDCPMGLLSTSTKRRSIIFITATTELDKALTVTLTGYDASISDIEGVFYSTLGGAVNATALTWSGAVLTLTSIGENEIGVIVNHT